MTQSVALMVSGAAPADTVAEVRAPYDGSLIATVEQADNAAARHAIAPGTRCAIEHGGEEATTRGAEVLCGGASIGETCYAPTVLYDPPDDTMDDMQIEKMVVIRSREL